MIEVGMLWYVCSTTAAMIPFIIGLGYLESRLRLHEYEKWAEKADARPRVNNVPL